jgi:hypothetical protein
VDDVESDRRALGLPSIAWFADQAREERGCRSVDYKRRNTKRKVEAVETIGN